MNVVEKDIKLAALAFKVDDFQLVNILGNRVMSDSVFIGKAHLAVTGFFIKQMALAYLNMKTQLASSEYLEAKLIGEEYITYLSNNGETVDKVEAWAKYHQYNLDIRKYPGTGFNKQMAEVYDQDHETTQEVRKWLINFLQAKKTFLYDNRNNLLEGIIGEFQRIGLALGYQLEDTLVFSCMIALDRYYEYFRLQYATQTDQIDKKVVETEIFPFIDRIVALSALNPINLDIVNTYLCDLIRGWREYFICYGELSPKVPKRHVELNKETKGKLSEVLNKALQKELKT